MAERGMRYPWRIRFVWAQPHPEADPGSRGVSGCETRATERLADDLAAVLRRNADRIGVAIRITIEHREDPNTRRTVTYVPPEES